MAGELVTTDGQVQWGDLLIGAADLWFRGITGWLDLPGVRAADVDRSGRHGQFPGELRAGSRVMEVSFEVSGTDATALRRLRDATTWTSNPQEQELAVWVGTDEPRLVMARVHRRSIPTDMEYARGHRRGTLQFVATDPHQYGLTLHQDAVGLAQPSTTGLSFPLSFPLDFGPPGLGGSVTVTNTGSADTWPVITITGPVTGPVITNTDTGERLLFDPDWTVPAGQDVVIDTDSRTVLHSGVSRRDRLFTAEWFPIPAGSSVSIAFTSASYDPDALMTVHYRDTWM